MFNVYCCRYSGGIFGTVTASNSVKVDVSFSIIVSNVGVNNENHNSLEPETRWQVDRKLGCYRVN